MRSIRFIGMHDFGYKFGVMMIAADLSIRCQQLNTFRSNINNFKERKIYDRILFSKNNMLCNIPNERRHFFFFFFFLEIFKQMKYGRNLFTYICINLICI